jgi:hypothetical protein
MKVGDLVTMPNSQWNLGPGIVAKMPYVGPNGEQQQTPRVGVIWLEGDGCVDWEPMCWLEVINEAR